MLSFAAVVCLATAFAQVNGQFGSWGDRFPAVPNQQQLFNRFEQFKPALQQQLPVGQNWDSLKQVGQNFANNRPALQNFEQFRPALQNLARPENFEQFKPALQNLARPENFEQFKPALQNLARPENFEQFRRPALQNLARPEASNFFKQQEKLNFNQFRPENFQSLVENSPQIQSLLARYPGSKIQVDQTQNAQVVDDDDEDSFESRAI